jgi:CheY-like chemotaxis protein
MMPGRSPHDVLLVDDDDEYREALLPVLLREALGPDTRVTALQYVAAAREHLSAVIAGQLPRPALVLLDMAITWDATREEPEPDGGLQILRGLRASEPADGTPIPVVVFTAFPETAHEEEAMRLGASAYVSKVPWLLRSGYGEDAFVQACRAALGL